MTAFASDPTEVLLQYKAIGAMLVLCIGAIAFMYRHGLKQAEKAILREAARADKESERADRNEEALARLNESIQERVMPVVFTMIQESQRYTALTEQMMDELKRRDLT